MQINQNNSPSFGALRFNYGEIDSKAGKVYQEIEHLFNPNGVSGCGEAAMFFKKAGQEPVAKKMLEDAKIPHIQVDDSLLKDSDARWAFKSIDIFA